MKFFILSLLLILGSGCNLGEYLKDKPSVVVQKSGEELLLRSSNIVDLAMQNEKSAVAIQKDPATINSETTKIIDNSHKQVAEANAISDQGKTLKKESKEIKKTEDAADKSSIPSRLLAFSGIMAVLGTFCIVIYFVLPVKNNYILSAGLGCFALGIVALVLREYWTEFMIGATIAVVLGLIYFGRLIYISFNDAQTHRNVSSELVNLFEVIKKKYPDIKKEVFGDSTNPVGLAYHLLSDRADEVIAEIRGKDVPPKAS